MLVSSESPDFSLLIGSVLFCWPSISSISLSSRAKRKGTETLTGPHTPTYPTNTHAAHNPALTVNEALCSERSQDSRWRWPALLCLPSPNTHVLKSPRFRQLLFQEAPTKIKSTHINTHAHTHARTPTVHPHRTIEYISYVVGIAGVRNRRVVARGCGRCRFLRVSIRASFAATE